jgi:biopolymer transport protein ExbB
MQTNAYGLMNLWQQGDGITRTVAVFLLAMSVLSWSVILIKGIQLKQVRQQADSTNNSSEPKAFSSADENAKATKTFNPFGNLRQEGLKALSYHNLHRRQLEKTINQNEWLQLTLKRCIDTAAQTLQADLPILASIGSTAPFVGLFGTVWGIYHALVRISASGQSSIDQIAGPVGEALIMTAFGLAVAIPAVLGYNFILQSHKKILAQLRNFAQDLQMYLLVEQAVVSFSELDALDESQPTMQRLEEGVGV